MKEKEAKKLELNTKILEDFEQIMATKLDEVEELKITQLDKTSRLLNIISLCANVKTLILEGDQRLNADQILANIFKPEKLENLIFNNVKVPKKDALKRYPNLKMLSLNDIRFCDVKGFLESIVAPEKIEIMNISNSDMLNQSSVVLERFANMKYLNLNRVKNFKLDALAFLKENRQLLKINIIEGKIPVTQINDLLECSCQKNIKAEILGAPKKWKINAKMEINDKNKTVLNLPIENLEEVYTKMNLSYVDTLNLLVNEVKTDVHSIQVLKKLNTQIHVIVKDFACLNAESAKKIKNMLKLDEIEFTNKRNIDIISYIEIRLEMEKIVKQAEQYETQAQQFLAVYKILGQTFEIDEKENLDIKAKKCNTVQLCEFLQNCLICLKIQSNPITGENLETEKKHTWNQVKIEGKWYNVDLALDRENIQKNKTEYCLICDQKFFENHTPKAGKNHYCEQDFNPKLVKVFFKTGLFKENLMASYLEILAQKIRTLFHFNRKQEVLAFPESESGRKHQN